MGTFCIRHYQSEELKPNHHLQVGDSHNLLGFWQKECSPNHLSLIAANKERCVYTVPRNSVFFHIHRVFLIWYGEKDCISRAKKYAKIHRSAWRNYITPRDTHYWKTEKNFGFPHSTHAWTQILLLPSCSLPFPAGSLASTFTPQRWVTPNCNYFTCMWKLRKTCIISLVITS